MKMGFKKKLNQLWSPCPPFCPLADAKGLSLPQGERRKAVLKDSGYSLVEIMVVLGIVSVLAMVSIPMYSSYLNKAKASEGLTLVAPIKMAVTSFLIEHGSLDSLRSNQDLDLKDEIHGTYVENIKILNLGLIDVIYKDNLGDLLFVPKVINNSQIDWDCQGGSLDQSYRPNICKNKK